MDEYSPTWEIELKRLPRELLHPTLEHAVELKPFSKKEIEWLLNQLTIKGPQGSISNKTYKIKLTEIDIFYSNGKYAKMDRYYQHPTKNDHVIQGKYVQTSDLYGGIYYDIREPKFAPYKLLKIGRICTTDNPYKRPTLQKVLEMLE